LFQVVPRKRFNDVVAKNGVGLAFATMGMTSFLDGPAAGSGLGAVGETKLTPDLSTKRRISWYTSSFIRGSSKLVYLVTYVLTSYNFLSAFFVKCGYHYFIHLMQLCSIHYRSKEDEMVLGDLNVKPGQAWEYCPREALRRVSKILKDEFDLVCCIACLIFYAL